METILAYVSPKAKQVLKTSYAPPLKSSLGHGGDRELERGEAAPAAVAEGRWRIEVRRPYVSDEDSLASNKAGAFLL
jgi:hypothetical protein